MTKPAYSDWLAGSALPNGPGTIAERQLAAIAALVAGTNPDGTAAPLATSSSGPGAGATAPTAANILVGYQTFAATTGATTVITVPAGRTWTGTVAISASCTEAAAGTVAGQALGVVSVAGAGASPAAGNIFDVQASAGANATTGTVGSQGNNFGAIPLTVNASGGNAVTIQVTTTIAGTSGRISCTASGVLY